MQKAGGSPERAPEAFPGPWPPAPVTGPGPALCRLEQKTGPALSRAGRSAHGPGVRSQSTAPPSAWAAQGGRCRELPGPCEDTPAAECAHRGPGCGGAGLCWNAPLPAPQGPTLGAPWPGSEGWERRGKGRVGPSWESHHPPTCPQRLPACPGLPARPPHPAMERSQGNRSTTPERRAWAGRAWWSQAQGTQPSVHAPGSPKAGCLGRVGSWEGLGHSVAVGAGRPSARLLDTASTPW